MLPAPNATLRILKKRASFLVVARQSYCARTGLVLQAGARPQSGACDDSWVGIGFTCSKKVGNAVARNRAKRRLRAIAREILPRHARRGWNYVLIGRAGKTAERPYDLLRADLLSALKKLHK